MRSQPKCTRRKLISAVPIIRHRMFCTSAPARTRLVPHFLLLEPLRSPTPDVLLLGPLRTPTESPLQLRRRLLLPLLLPGQQQQHHTFVFLLPAETNKLSIRTANFSISAHAPISGYLCSRRRTHALTAPTTQLADSSRRGNEPGQGLASSIPGRSAPSAGSPCPGALPHLEKSPMTSILTITYLYWRLPIYAHHLRHSCSFPPIPCIIFTLLFALPPIDSRNSDPGSHSNSRLFSPPSPLRFTPCTFIARRLQPFLLSSTRVDLRLPTLGALSS